MSTMKPTGSLGMRMTSSKISLHYFQGPESLSVLLRELACYPHLNHLPVMRYVPLQECATSARLVVLVYVLKQPSKKIIIIALLHGATVLCLRQSVVKLYFAEERPEFNKNHKT